MPMAVFLAIVNWDSDKERLENLLFDHLSQNSSATMRLFAHRLLPPLTIDLNSVIVKKTKLPVCFTSIFHIGCFTMWNNRPLNQNPLQVSNVFGRSCCKFKRRLFVWFCNLGSWRAEWTNSCCARHGSVFDSTCRWHSEVSWVFGKTTLDVWKQKALGFLALWRYARTLVSVFFFNLLQQLPQASRHCVGRAAAAQRLGSGRNGESRLI